MLGLLGKKISLFGHQLYCSLKISLIQLTKDRNWIVGKMNNVLCYHGDSNECYNNQKCLFQLDNLLFTKWNYFRYWIIKTNRLNGIGERVMGRHKVKVSILIKSNQLNRRMKNHPSEMLTLYFPSQILLNLLFNFFALSVFIPIFSSKSSWRESLSSLHAQKVILDILITVVQISTLWFAQVRHIIYSTKSYFQYVLGSHSADILSTLQYNITEARRG